MAVAFKAAVAIGVGTSSSTTLVCTTNAAIAVDDLVVVRVATDNLSATTPTHTVTDSGGNTYVRHYGGANNATAAAGVAGSIHVTKATTAVNTGGTITITLSGAVAHKACFVQTFTGVENTVRSAAVGASGASTAAASPASGTVNAGDLVLGTVSAETRAAITGDSDTTNGTWSGVTSQTSATSGSDATCVHVGGQFKIPNAAGAQTFNATIASTDWVASLVVLQATPDPTITQAAYQFFDDAGTESGAAALAALNTAVTGNLAVGDGYGMIRVRLQSTNTTAIPATDDFKLQWEKNASGSWADVTAVGGAEALSDSYTTQVGTPAVSSVPSGRGQSFMGDGKMLTKAGMYNAKSGGTPTGQLRAYLYDHTGSFGGGGIPTGTALAASSTTVDISTLGSLAWKYFTFDGTLLLAAGTPYVLTVQVELGSNLAGNTVQYGINSSGTHPGNSCSSTDAVNWSAVAAADHCFEVYTTPPSTAAAIPYDNPNLTESQATTNRLGAGTGTFVAGKVSEAGHVQNVGWSANNYTEILYSVKLLAAQLANGDTLRFRVIRNGSTANMTYSVTPTINITLVVGPVDLVVQNASHAHAADNVAPGVSLTAANAAHAFAVVTVSESYLTPSVGRASTPDWGSFPTTGWVLVHKVLGPIGGGGSQAIASQNVGTSGASTDWGWCIFRDNTGMLATDWHDNGTQFPGRSIYYTAGWGAPDTVNPEYFGGSYNYSTGATQVWRSTNGGTSYNSSDYFAYSPATVPQPNPSDPIIIGANGTGSAQIWDSRIYWVELRTGENPTGGTVLWRFDANEHVSGTSWVDARGKTWTLTSAAAVTHTTVTDPTLTESVPTNLVVQNAAHAHAAGSPTLTEVLAPVNLVVANATHSVISGYGTGGAASPYLFEENWNAADDTHWDWAKWPVQRPWCPIVSNRGQVTGSGGPTVVASDKYVTDFEMTVKMSWDGASPGYPEICWRLYDGLGGYAASAGYCIQIHPGGTVNLLKIGAYATLGAGTVSVVDASLSAAGTRWFKVRVVGTSHKVKWWNDGSGEPGTWQLDGTDTVPQVDTQGNPVVGGAIGFRNYGSPPNYYVDDLTVVDLASPPLPVTDGSMRMLSNGKAITMNGSSNVFPSDTDLTWCGWVNYSGYSGNSWDIWSTFSGGSTYCSTSITPTGDLRQYMDTGDFSAGYNVPLNTWVFVAMSRSITGGTDLYWAPAGTSTLSTIHNASKGTVSGLKLRVLSGEYGSNPYANGCAFKVWTAALTKTQLEAEMTTYAVQRTANLFLHYSMKNGLFYAPDNDPLNDQKWIWWEAGGFVSGPVATHLLDAPAPPAGGVIDVPLVVDLAVQSATHAPVADNVVLTVPSTNLVVADATHAHAARSDTVPASLLSYDFADTGTTVNDRSGNGRNATLSGGAAQTAGQLVISGPGQRLAYTPDAAALPTYASVTVKVRTSGNLTSHNIWTKMRVSNSSNFNLYCDGIRLAAVVRGTTVVGPSIIGLGPTIAINTTYQVALTYDGTTTRMYLNGVEAATATTATGPLDMTGADTTWNMGSTPLDTSTPIGYPVYFDDLRFFDFALSAAQVATIAVTPVGGGVDVPLVVNLAVQSATHAHVADNVTLNYVVLAPAAAVHTPTAASPFLVVDLAVQGAVHAPLADNVITNYVVLAPADSLHAHTVDNVGMGSSLTVQDASHAHSTDNVSLNVDLYPQGATHLPVVENVVVENVVVAQGAAHAITSDAPTLYPVPMLAPAAAAHAVTDNAGLEVVLPTQGATHAHAADGVTLNYVVLAAADAVHASTAQVPVLVVDPAVQGAAHAVISDNVNLVVDLAVQGAVHTPFAENVLLQMQGDLAIQSALHNQVTDNVSPLNISLDGVQGAVHATAAGNVVVEYNLTAVQSAAHAHSAATVLITPALLVDAAVHAQAAGAVALVVDLAVQGAAHAITDNLTTLTQVHNLAVADAVHTPVAANPDLGQIHNLAMDNSVHAVFSTTVSLASGSTLLVADSAHTQSAEAPALLQDHRIVAADGVLAHSAGSVVIYAVPMLVVVDGLHTQTVPQVPYTQIHNLAIDSAFHAHAAEDIALAFSVTLIMQAALHAHTAGSPGIREETAVLLSYASAVFLGDQVVDRIYVGEVQAWP